MKKNMIIPALCAAALALALFGAAAQARAPFLPAAPAETRQQATPVFLKDLMNRLFGRGGVLSGDSVFTVRTRVHQTDPDVHR